MKNKKFEIKKNKRSEKELEKKKKNGFKGKQICSTVRYLQPGNDFSKFSIINEVIIKKQW